jgi:nicotinamidase-related amidase
MERFHIGRNDTALVVVDIQERLAAVMEHRARVVANTLHLIEAAKLFSIPVLVTEQYPKGLGPTLAEIREALPSPDPVEKIAFSCCGESHFPDRLASTRREKVVVAGMESHVCVLQTVLDLLRTGYQVHVVDDAVCSRREENHRTALALMRDAGAVITCTETVLFQLLVRAGTEEFKTISRRIR